MLYHPAGSTPDSFGPRNGDLSHGPRFLLSSRAGLTQMRKDGGVLQELKKRNLITNDDSAGAAGVGEDNVCRRSEFVNF
jgi:hypothetical protein